MLSRGVGLVGAGGGGKRRVAPGFAKCLDRGPNLFLGAGRREGIMPDYRDDEDYGRRDRPASGDTGTRDMLDLVGRRLSGAVMVAGALIGAGIYMGGDRVEAPDYQIYAQDGEVFRLNTDSGSIIACNGNRCMQVLKRGQDLAEGQGNTLFKTPPAQLPAPAPAQAQTQPQAPQQPAQPK